MDYQRILSALRGVSVLTTALSGRPVNLDLTRTASRFADLAVKPTHPGGAYPTPARWLVPER